MGFKGTYLNKFDEAGRISLPAKMRDELKANNWGNTLVAYYAFITKCVKIVPGSVFEKMEKEYLENPPTDGRKVRAYKAMFASSVDLEINGSGRISIPASLRDKAELGEECYVIGVNDKIEIWNKEAWQAQIAEIEAELSSKDAFDDGINGLLF